jgi:hypothetical protein
MRCLSCGSEMTWMEVVPDDTIGVPGFERRTFMCSECQDFEERLVFTKHGRESDAIAMPVHAAPSIEPPSTVHDEPVVTSGLFRRVLAKLRSR